MFWFCPEKVLTLETKGAYIPFIELQVDDQASQFGCWVRCCVWIFLTVFCSMFVDHPQSLLASLESLQSSEVIEEHSAQLDWIIKVTKLLRCLVIAVLKKTHFNS